jgi:hypothetical protein
MTRTDALCSLHSIVFVHGLTGDRDRSWSVNNAAPWPQSLLPSRVSNARIFTFGYDASVADVRRMVSQNRIANHSMNLLNAVATCRDDDDTVRSLCKLLQLLGSLAAE